MGGFSIVSTRSVPRGGGRAYSVSWARAMAANTIAEIWGYRSLIHNLAQRDLRARYKKSILGWMWSLINPASMLLIYSVVFGSFLRVVPPPAGNPEIQSFALYLFAALTVWNLFNGVLTGAINALEGMGSLLNKVYFPPAAPAIATAATVVPQAFIELGVLLVVMLVVGNGSWAMLLSPLVFVPVVMFALGIGIALSAYNVLYRDVGYIVSIALNVLFYATPIIYTIDLVPEELAGIPVRRLIELNPVTKFVYIMRELVYLGRLPSAETVLYAMITAAVTLALGWVLFNRKSREVIEEL